MLINKLSFIVPAYNEGNTVQLVLKNVFELSLLNDIEKELIVVNDCSTDNTGEEIELFIKNNPDYKIISYLQTVNKGKGAAIHKGISLATGEYLIIQDADLELVPSDINFLLKEVITTGIDVVYGSRFLNGNHQNNSFVWSILANRFLTRLSNLFSGYKLTDMMTCYKLIPTSVIQSIHLKEKRFGFEPEITMKLAKIKHLNITEVPISYIARTKKEGKKINAGDGIRVIYCIIKYRFFN